MDGVHDMGGMHGFGSTRSAGDDLPYHEGWEPRVFALHMMIGAELPAGPPGGRATREEMPPAEYLAASYYERWLWSAERRLERGGAIVPGDVEAMMERLRAGEEVPPRRDPGLAAAVVAELRDGEPLPDPTACAFRPGDRVRVRRMRPAGHTRAPRYVRGVAGVVERVRGADRLPDLATYGIQTVREPVYAVSFRSQDIWGDPPHGETPWTVVMDLWESYLEEAP